MKKTINIIIFVLLISLGLNGCRSSAGKDAEKTANEFGLDIYMVSSEEVDNYGKLLSLKTTDTKELDEAIRVNDNTLKDLMTADAYDKLLKNRENLIFAQACYEGRYTIQVSDLRLSENTYDIKENKAGYNYEAELKFISEDGTEHTESAKGFIGLIKEDGAWKVSEYRNTVPDYIESTLSGKTII
ncbi:MAG TPA: hypothetical protein DCM73_14020 [Clostridiales bacterium]|nr:hypothetical protein [Clostridiales bacterium]